MVLFSAGILLAGVCRSSAAEPPMSVYVVDEFARVRPHDGAGAGHAAVLGAARNEYAPFQIVVRAGAGGLKRVNASASPLMAKRGKAISAAQITLYREHSVEVRKLSPKSKGAPGWYPDALIPFLDPSTGKPPVRARFAAAPFDIAPDSNQPLWVDVLTPQAAHSPDRTDRLGFRIARYAFDEDALWGRRRESAGVTAAADRGLARPG
jgi:hypothetical protein